MSDGWLGQLLYDVGKRVIVEVADWVGCLTPLIFEDADAGGFWERVTSEWLCLFAIISPPLLCRCFASRDDEKRRRKTGHGERDESLIFSECQGSVLPKTCLDRLGYRGCCPWYCQVEVIQSLNQLR